MPEGVRVTMTSQGGTTVSLIEPLGVSGTVIDRHIDDLCQPGLDDDGGNVGPDGGSGGAGGLSMFDGGPAGGSWTLTIENYATEPGTLENFEWLLLVEEIFERGDGNVDGLIDIADVIFTLFVIFPPPIPAPIHTCTDALDMNDDGLVNIADPISLLAHLFTGGGPPTSLPAPFGACGEDPTPDTLNCESYLVCP